MVYLPKRLSIVTLSGLIAAGFLTGCGTDAPEPAGLAVERKAAEPAIVSSEVVSSPEKLTAAGCDADRALKVFEQCRVCHSVAKGADNLTGPNLFGVVGRPAASRDGFAYSKVIKESGIIWDAETLEAFLSKPFELLPNNRMAFGGVTNVDDRQAIVCLLTTLG